MRVSALLTALMAALAVTVFAGCGEEADVHREAETEGLWVNLGALSYQIQVSRQLNPADIEDRGYLFDLPPFAARLAPGEIFFGVFVQAKNESGGSSGNPARTETTADQIEIIDVQEHAFKPLPVGPKNAFAYRSVRLSPEGVIPSPDSAAANAPTQGSLLIFKLSQKVLQNRPLEFKLKSSELPGEEASVTLDV